MARRFDMTLEQILKTMHDGDEVAIHNEVGFVVFNSIIADMKKPVAKKIISMYLDHPVVRIRAYESAVIILLGAEEEE